MISLFVNSEGGLTTAGYVLSIGVMVVCVLAGLALSDRTEKNRTFSARRLAYCAMAVALAYVTSFIKPFELPYGGSVTLLSMLFIVLVGNWYGVKTGVLVGLAYGVLQFLQEPYFLSLFQVCCDYVLAFDRVHCGGAGPWLLPLSGRVSLLDGLHAGKLSPVPAGAVSHHLQLQLPPGRGSHHGHHHSPSGGVQRFGAHPQKCGPVNPGDFLGDGC